MAKKNFEISPRILYHFGEDLIKNEEIALFELVKNAYDACASKCEIFFKYEDKELKEIIIEDDGTGMDKSVIENIWLVIGTDNKSDIKDIKCKREGQEFIRVPLGEKGIGRLSIHKLGNEITLYSKTNDDPEVKVHIDWDEIKKADKLEHFFIDVDDEHTDKGFMDGSGTKIVVNKIKGKWNKRKLRKLYRSLLSLNSPFEGTVDNFKVIVDSSDKRLFEGLPSLEEIKRSALYYGKCKIEGDRITDFTYEFRPWDVLKKVQKRRKTIADLKLTDCALKKIVKNQPVDLNLSNYKIGPIELEILIYDFDPSFMNFNFSNAVIEKSSLREYLNENGGIRVYRDGIRVYDYGIEHDWLGIDLKRVGRVGGKISNNIVIGAVKLNRKSSADLKEKTNREGFVENEAYFALVDAVNFALDKIVLERNIDKSRLKELYKKHKVSEPVLSDLEEVKELVEKKVKDKDTKNDIVQYLERINKQYQEVKEVLIRSANAGLNLSVVIHEIEKLIYGLSGAVKSKDIEKIKSVAEQLEKIVQSFNVMIKSSKIKEDFLSSIVQSALDTFHFRFKDHNIKLITNHNDVEYKAYFAKSEAVSVLANLLDNSIFWLSYSKISDRKLSIFVTDQIEGYYSIIVSDNGPGFSISPQDAVKPFISAKPHSIGSGLGLHIADEMMKAMKGKLRFFSEHDIELPQNILSEGVTKAIVALCFPTKKAGE
jgi:signal transduction histidine kinase